MSDFSDGHDLGKLQGKREEQQRIIKRLDSGEFTTEVFEWFTQHIPHTEPLSESAVEDLSERLIALIDGESK